MTTDDLLRQGIAALKAGRKAEARNLLMQVVEQDEHNEMAWLWLSGAVDTDEERRICLENVLAINPNNGVARRGLESLTVKEGIRSLSAVSSLTPRAEPATTPCEQLTQSSAEASAPDVTQGKKRMKAPKRRKATRRQTRLIIGLGGVVLALACIALAGIWWASDSGLLPSKPVVPGSVGTTQAPSAADNICTPEVQGAFKRSEPASASRQYLNTIVGSVSEPHWEFEERGSTGCVAVLVATINGRKEDVIHWYIETAEGMIYPDGPIAAEFAPYIEDMTLRR